MMNPSDQPRFPWLRALFFAVIVKPVLAIVLGFNIRHRDRLIADGPLILVSNHNSHLDTWALMNLFPLRMLRRVRPVAAMDYFLTSRFMTFFARELAGIIPINRKGGGREDVLAGCNEALERGDILILFPEGSRGRPEHRSTFRAGIAHLAKRHPSVPVQPVFLYGLGKTLPRGAWLPVPFYCDMVIGEPIEWTGDRAVFMESLETNMQAMAEELPDREWERK